MAESTDPTIKLRGGSPGASGIAPWVALGVAAAALICALGVIWMMGGRAGRLRAEKRAAAAQAAAAEQANAELSASLAQLSGRLAEAETRCR